LSFTQMDLGAFVGDVYYFLTVSRSISLLSAELKRSQRHQASIGEDKTSETFFWL